MFRFGQGRWSVVLEDGFRGELEDGTACIAREDGEGALLVSAVDKSQGPVTHDELAVLARGECPEDASFGDCELGDFRGVHAMYADDGVRWHRWYLGHGSLILLVTYTAPVELEGAEADAVMTMLRSLKARGESWR